MESETHKERWKGKNLLLFVGFGCVVIGLLFLFYGYTNTWRLWGVPSMTPHFADLRGIIAGAESHRLGYDPLVSNPADFWGRRLNYPRIWQESFFVLGINQSHATCLGVLFILLFMVGVFLFSGKVDNVTARFLAFGVFSPAVMLGIERANADLVIFFILALALFSLRKSSFVSLSLIIVGFFLKLYPLFGLSCLLRENRKKFAMLAVISLIIISAYAGFTFKDLLQIYRITDRSIEYSFGANVFGMFIRRIIPNYPLTENLFRFLPDTVLLLLLIFVLWLNKREIHSSIPKEHEYIDSFRMGSAIYLGLFAWGNNYDYKLMFLLFMIPQVLVWTRYAPQRIALISRLTISATMFSFWYMFILRFVGSRSFGGFAVFFLEQLSSWVIFGGLLYLFVYSMPEWAGHYIGRTRSR